MQNLLVQWRHENKKKLVELFAAVTFHSATSLHILQNAKHIAKTCNGHDKLWSNAVVSTLNSALFMSTLIQFKHVTGLPHLSAEFADSCKWDLSVHAGMCVSDKFWSYGFSESLWFLKSNFSDFWQVIVQVKKCVFNFNSVSQLFSELSVNYTSPLEDSLSRPWITLNNFNFTQMISNFFSHG